MAQPSEREIEVFNVALELPAGERAVYLDRACVGDAALRQRVEELLKSSEVSCDFLKTADSISSGPGGTVRVSLTPAEKAGDRIGRYRLLQQIGEGGCGVVYMAEQEEPVRRRVALKVIKLGMDTKQVIARFEAERQALALMDHPNIAKVLDAGATEAGRPFFVMELVRGVKITEYCDEHNLSTVARLELFVLVCQAIQHAHQKGVIHRDIKPSNILVADHDGVPVPKIIDFGIAKATTDQRLTDKTVFTAFEQFIGTPAYMSPEQAKLSGLDIDTRSDIYSLGVLLYELLTGKTPFEAKRLMEAGLDELRRIIREEEPVTPSTRLETLDAAEQTTVAKHRQSDPPKLAHMIRGDLDWIVMRALEKDRARRYETANGLAMDVRRYLTNDPVVARPPSSLYRLHKLVMRNSLAFIAASAVMASLLIGLGVATWSFFKEQQARQQAEAERKTAKMEAAKATAISDFFQQSLRAANPDERKSSDYTVRQLLDDYSAGLKGQFTNQPEIEAAVRETIGKAYYRLGVGNKAQMHLERALVLNRQLYGEHEQVATTLADCAWASLDLAQLTNAESQARAALEIYRKESTVGQPVLFALWALQDILYLEERYDDSELVGKQALEVARKTPNIEYPETASILHGLAESVNAQGRYAEGETLARQAVAIHRRLQGSEHPETGWALMALGQALAGQNKLDDAERADREALSIFRRQYSSGHRSVDDATSFLRGVLAAKADLPGLVALDQTTLADQRSVLGENNPTVVETLIGLANDLREQGKQTDADKALQEAVDISHKLLQQRPASEPPGMLNAINDTVDSCYSIGRDNEATSLSEQICELYPKNTDASLHMAILQTWFGQGADYEATRRRLVQEAEGTDQAGTAERAAKAYCLRPSTDAGLSAKALNLARRGVELGQNSGFMRYYQLCLGLAEYRNGYYAAAERTLTTLTVPETTAVDHDEVLGTARFFRAMCLFQENRPEEARKLFSRAENEMPPFPKDERKPLLDGKPVFHEVLICWLAYKEAKALIEGPSAPVAEPSVPK
jgi:eukaryotic-like serine/threonine-protein kinase